MTRNKYSFVREVVFAAALAAGVVGTANADDSSIGRFGGDSYRYFVSTPIDRSPSTYRLAHPSGVSERELQAYSGASTVWDLDKPVVTNVASDPTFKQTHPNGLTERELQALSSEAPVWHAFESSVRTATAQDAKMETVASRSENLLHPAK